MRYLVDVDGVVADMIRGFDSFLYVMTGERLPIERMSMHKLSRCPEVAHLHAKYDLESMLSRFLENPDVYGSLIPPIDGAILAIHELLARGHEVGFVTAVWHSAPASYGSKLRWLHRMFPDVPMLAVRSDEKHWVRGDRAIDDRYDTCARWAEAGVPAMLFRQPWNEAPPGTRTYDWQEILDADR